jgi:hypothetical protein
MKDLIVFYVPTDSVPSSKKARKRMAKSFKKNRPENTDVILIEDPNIERVHTEVFFKPE